MKEWTVEELEDLAYKREPMPDLRSQAQALLFQSFRGLYQYAAMAGMSQELGRSEKAKILEAHRICFIGLSKIPIHCNGR